MQAQILEKAAPFKTRFGEVTYDENKTLSFPNGILGMPNQTNFFITTFPAGKMDKFQVLQSLNEQEVSFALVPLASLPENTIEASDLEEVRKVLEMTADDMLVMLIVSIQKTPSGSRLSVNVRAPLFINAEAKTGYQIVLANSKYPVQHFLG